VQAELAANLQRRRRLARIGPDDGVDVLLEQLGEMFACSSPSASMTGGPRRRWRVGYRVVRRSCQLMTFSISTFCALSVARLPVIGRKLRCP
jgi:hypothetical protein